MTQAKKKRMQPRHLLTAALIGGLIPKKCVSEIDLSPEQQSKLVKYLN